MSLPFDVARCVGTTAPVCQFCRRREPGDPVRQWYVSPEWTIDGCPNFIEPEEKRWQDCEDSAKRSAV